MGFLRISLFLTLVIFGSVAQAADPLQTISLIQRMLPMEGFSPYLDEEASLGNISDWGWEIKHKIKTTPLAIRELNKAIAKVPAAQGDALKTYSAWLAQTVVQELDTIVRQTTENWIATVQAALAISASAKGDPHLRDRLDQAWIALESLSAFEYGSMGAESEETGKMRDSLAVVEGKWLGKKGKAARKYTIPSPIEEDVVFSEIARQALSLSTMSATLGQPVVMGGEVARAGILHLAKEFHATAWREMEAWALETANDGEFVRVVLFRNYSQPPPGIIGNQWLIHRSWRLGPVDIPSAKSLTIEADSDK